MALLGLYQGKYEESRCFEMMPDEVEGPASRGHRANADLPGKLPLKWCVCECILGIVWPRYSHIVLSCGNILLVDNFVVRRIFVLQVDLKCCRTNVGSRFVVQILVPIV